MFFVYFIGGLKRVNKIFAIKQDTARCYLNVIFIIYISEEYILI